MPLKHRKTTFAVSRRQQSILLAFGVLLISLLIGLDHSLLRHKRHFQPQSAPVDFEKYNAKTFTVVKVVDGDTIDIDVPYGKYNHTRIRLWGIDTPETKSRSFGMPKLDSLKLLPSAKPDAPVAYFGPQAYEFTKSLTLGKPVTVYLDKADTRDKYDRLLAYIQLPDGRFLNEVLLGEGFAYADTRFKHSFYHKYKQLESAARSSKKGLWEKVTPDQMPEWRQ